MSPYTVETNGRRKKNLDETVDDETTEIKLEAFGEQFHMRLKENRYLLAEGLQVGLRHANGSITTSLLNSTQRCFYIGQLVSHSASKVAVSTCNGLVSVWRETIFVSRFAHILQCMNDSSGNRSDCSNPFEAFWDISYTEEWMEHNIQQRSWN